MGILITYILFSYPLLALLLWYRFKIMDKDMSDDPDQKTDWETVKNIWNNSAHIKKLKGMAKSPDMIILWVVLYIVLAPFTFPIVTLWTLNDIINPKKRGT